NLAGRRFVQKRWPPSSLPALFCVGAKETHRHRNAQTDAGACGAEAAMRSRFRSRLNKKNGRIRSLIRQVGRCLFPSIAERRRTRSEEKPCLPVGACPTLPIAQGPIGKVRPCEFRMRMRNGDGTAAPESLPTKSVIGDGR